MKNVHNKNGQLRKGECITMYFVLFQNSESTHVRNAFQPPTLPFPVSFGCLVQPNYIVHVKICALKPVPSPWNISQYATNQQINKKILFLLFCFAHEPKI